MEQIQELKIGIKTFAQVSKFYRKEERKQRNFGRFLIQSKKYKHSHQKGEPRPAAPSYEGLKKFENPQTEAEKAYDRVWNLHQIRAVELRKETRRHLLAYAFLRGKPLEFAEDSGSFSLPNFDSIFDIASEFVPEEDERVLSQRFEEWKQQAVDAWHLRGNLNIRPKKENKAKAA